MQTYCHWFQKAFLELCCEECRYSWFHEPGITTLITLFCEGYHGITHRSNSTYAEVMKIPSPEIGSYDIKLLVGVDYSFRDNWVTSGGANNRGDSSSYD